MGGGIYLFKYQRNRNKDTGRTHKKSLFYCTKILATSGAPRPWSEGAEHGGADLHTQVTAGCHRLERQRAQDTWRGSPSCRPLLPAPLHVKHEVKLTQILSQPSDRYYKSSSYLYIFIYVHVTRIWTNFLGPSFPFLVWLMVL